MIKKFPINTYSRCRILNINMEDSTGMVRVSAFNSLSDKMNGILEVCFDYKKKISSTNLKLIFFLLIFILKENKMYYLIDTTLKHITIGCELKIQSNSVVIECFDQPLQKLQYTRICNFDNLLKSNPSKFCGKYFCIYNTFLN